MTHKYPFTDENNIIHIECKETEYIKLFYQDEYDDLTLFLEQEIQKKTDI